MADNETKKRVITISREYGSGGRLIGKRLAEKLGDPQAAVQFFMRDVTRDIKTAEAYAGSLHEIMGNVTVYGGDKTATSFADGLLGLLPKIKEMGTVLGQTIATGKEAIAEGKSSPDSVDDLGEKEFDDK